MVVGPIEPMLARTVDVLPRRCRGGCLYEPKWDGFRCIATVTTNGVLLWSRRRKRLDAAFPEVAMTVGRDFDPGTVVDGEIVRWSDGRLDFAALQRRNVAGKRASGLAGVEPCHYIVFDLLHLYGRDRTTEKLTRRRERMEVLFAAIGSTPLLALGMQTDDPDVAMDWYDGLADVGVEGLVVKSAADPYQPGYRGWLKYKKHASIDVIVGGVTGSLRRPQDLILGRYTSDTGELRVVGRTTALDDRQAAEIGPLLAATNDHPWPPELPSGWASGLYGQHQPRPYIRVRPSVVVEVRADVATEHGRWRHPLRYLRLRPDITIEDLPRDLNLER